MQNQGLPVWWRPVNEEEIAAAAATGLLEEGHYLDIKRELSSGKSVNKELARDLASFAVDGGRLIVGVDEDTEPPSLHPVALAGLAERVEQVARSIVDQPLELRTDVVSASSQADRGYLVISVPVSPLAPHMVDHI